MILHAPTRRPARSNALWGSDAARELLEYNGLSDIDRVWARMRPRRSRHIGRAVIETTLTASDCRPVRTFVKLYSGPRRWWPRMTDLKTGQVWQSLPLREWRGIERLEALGLSVPERLALFRDGLLRPRAAVILAAVPAPHSLDELLRQGRWQQLDPADREAILDQVVAIAGRIHAAGLAWRGICSRHYFPAKQRDGRWQLWLIDLEGVHRRRTARPIARDFAKLLRAMRASGADETTLNMLGAKIDAARESDR